VIVMHFRAARAKTMSAFVRGRGIVWARRARLTVRLRVPRGGRRCFVVVARNGAGTTRTIWSVS